MQRRREPPQQGAPLLKGRRIGGRCRSAQTLLSECQVCPVRRERNGREAFSGELQAVGLEL